MAIIGAIAVTLVLGYIAFWCFVMAIPPLIGFDEFHIPVGILLLAMGFVPCIVWWFVVGSRISIGFN